MLALALIAALILIPVPARPAAAVPRGCGTQSKDRACRLESHNRTQAARLSLGGLAASDRSTAYGTVTPLSTTGLCTV
jgi:hypothetical protein